MAEIRSLAGKHILITGAAGLIGSALTRRILSAEPTARVTAAVRDTGRAARLFAPWAGGRCRLLRYDAALPLASSESYDYIVHAASGAAPAAFTADPVGVMTAGFLGSLLLLDYGRAHGMERFLYVSSGEVYGARQSDTADAWREDDSGYVNPLLPRSCYPTAKRAAETLCAAYAAEHGTDIVVARPCHTFGPAFTPRDNRAYAQFLSRAAAGRDIALNSPGTQRRSWIYVEDCADALLTILLRGASGEAYNVADEGCVLTIRQFAEAIAQAAGVKVSVAGGGGAASPSAPHTVYDTAKLRALGWLPRHTLADALGETLDALRQGGAAT